MNKIKKTLSIILLIFFLYSQFVLVYANSLKYSKKIRGKIIDNFKEEQYDNIYKKNNTLLNEDVNFFETQNKIMIFENIRNNNLEKKEELDIQKQVLSDRATNLEETISLINEDIINTKNEIIALNRNIMFLFGEIEETKKDIELKNKEIFENKKILLEYIIHIYKKQNTLLSQDEKNIDSLKTVLLSNGSLGDILSELHFSSLLEVTGQSLIEKHRKLVKELFVKKLDLEKKNKNFKNSKTQELLKKKSLLEKKDFREKILSYTKGQEELFKEFIAEKLKVDSRLKVKIIQNKIRLKDQKQELLSKYNCDYIDDNLLVNDFYIMDSFDSNISHNCIELNKILAAESQLKPFSQESKNIFSWPVNPEKGLSAYYKDPSYFDIIGSSHDAIDIITPQGTDIIAPADGYITYVKDPSDEGYAYVVLKHVDGFITVYGHVNEVLFKQYDFIKAGVVFAKSGGEIGTNGAGMMTTGPHLHFEVFKNKEYVDPLNYLNLTQLGDDKIPKVQKYAYKFYDDYLEKNGTEYSGDLMKDVIVFKLEGDNEVERQKDLLSKYSTVDFNNWDMWIEESVDANIDPSFLMCIGLAETGLGRNLKTTYNIGNVGNTDSGGTWDFDNPRSGIYRMTKTLNNSFLGGYKELDKLSRYGNKSGSIYASSGSNWHNNMIKCLQALKAEHIPDNFNFRTIN